MRLYLFPITRSRTLIYCKRARIAPSSSGAKPPLVERVTAKANETWVKWESSDGGWKKTVVGWGNQLFARIAYEEWGLKSVPPLSRRRQLEAEELSKSSGMTAEAGAPDSARRKDEEQRRRLQATVVFPPRLLREGQVLGLLKHMATVNQGLYRQRMIYSILAMPLTLPFILIPVIPNLPFFYLVFRAWSYWRALGGSKHIDHLLDHNLVNPAPSEVLQRLYDVRAVDGGKVKDLQEKVNHLREEKRYEDAEDATIEELTMTAVADIPARSHKVEPSSPEQLLYPKGHGKIISIAMNMPEVEVELERAYDQVSKALEKDKEQEQAQSQQSGAIQQKKGQ